MACMAGWRLRVGVAGRPCGGGMEQGSIQRQSHLVQALKWCPSAPICQPAQMPSLALPHALPSLPIHPLVPARAAGAVLQGAGGLQQDVQASAGAAGTRRHLQLSRQPRAGQQLPVCFRRSCGVACVDVSQVLACWMVFAERHLLPSVRGPASPAQIRCFILRLVSAAMRRRAWQWRRAHWAALPTFACPLTAHQSRLMLCESWEALWSWLENRSLKRRPRRRSVAAAATAGFAAGWLAGWLKELAGLAGLLLRDCA